MPSPEPSIGAVAVIGAGIAGMSSARALKAAGADVTVFDGHGRAGGGASGTPAGLLQPRPLSDGSPMVAFFHAAYDHAARTYDELGDVWVSRGVLVLGRDEADGARYRPLPGAEAVDAAGCRAVSGIAADGGGTWFADGGSLDTAAVCAAMGDGADTRYQTRVAGLERQAEGWVLRCDDGSVHEAAAVVLANGLDATALSGFDGMTYRANRGQITYVTATGRSAWLTAPVTFGGYMTPAVDGTHVLGATFDREADWTSGDWMAVREEDHQRNMQSITARLPLLAAELGEVTGGWTGLRATTPDRLPVVGPVPAGDPYAAAFASLRPGGEVQGAGDDIYQPGLFTLSGLGSRGFLVGPLTGEILASQMLGLPLPVPVSVPELLHPGRFLIRDIRKGRV